MTQRQWVGLTGVLFGIVMLVGIFASGTTPDTGAGAIERYTEYWQDSGKQDRAVAGSIVVTFACVLLACFAAGLRHLLRAGDGGALPPVVLAAGSASSALFAVGVALINAPGIAAAESKGYEVDGNDALLLESVGYYTLTAAVMLAAAMAVAASLANRRARLVPQWTLVLTGLLALAGLGSIFTAWLGFLLLPVWAVVVGICLLLARDRAADVVVEQSRAPAHS